MKIADAPGGRAGLCLAAGFVLLVAAEASIPELRIAARWLAPVFLLRFVRLTRPWPGYFGISAISAVVVFVTQIGVIPMPMAGVATTAIIGALISCCAYLADRILTPRLPPWSASLVFPAAATALAYAGAQVSPFGTWGNSAYTAGLAGLEGLIAATGLWGATFLIGWVASAVNGVWDDGSRRSRTVLVVCLAMVAGILVYGMFFSQSQPANVATLKAAAITPVPGTPGILRCRGDDACRKRNSRQRLDALFTLSEEAVRQGAKVLLWSEGAAQILKRDEADVLMRASQFAARNNVYLFLGMVTVPERYPAGFLENKLVAVTPKGVSWEYRKSKPVPGEKIVRGPGRVPVLDTPYGRIAAVICFDADFPSLIRQASKAKSDILLVSANDWPAIAQIHADMALFRGVENGVSLIRASMNGRSVFATSTGKIVALRDTTAHGSTLLMGTVPARRSGTLYQMTGDLFAWLCLGFIALATAWVIKFRARQT